MDDNRVSDERVTSGLDYRLNPEADPQLDEYYGYHPKTGRAICAANSNKPNSFGDYVCLGHVLDGRMRCKMHGGASPRGVAHPSFKTGRHSLYAQLPDSMREGFEIVRNNPDLMNLDDDIAVVVTRANQLMEQLDTNGSRETWNSLRSEYDALLEAMRSGNTDDLRRHIETIDGLIKSGTNDASTWDEIMVTLEQRRKHVETNRRQYEMLGEFVHRDTVIAIMSKIMATIFNEVQDNRVRDRIREEFVAVFPRIEINGFTKN